LYGGAPPHTSVEEMAQHYLQEIRAVQDHGPYFLVGYCFGAIVAYEMAQRLLASGEKVAILASLNGPCPRYRNVPPGEPAADGGVWAVVSAADCAAFAATFERCSARPTAGGGLLSPAEHAAAGSPARSVLPGE